jgi:chemotaxis signal transduction protein
LCALPLAGVREIMRLPPVDPIAGAPAAVLGLSRVRGAPIPVIHVAALFGNSGAAPRRLVRAMAGERTVGLAVDDVLGVYSIAVDTVRDLPPILRGAASEIVDAIGTLDEELLLLLGTARLVAAAALDALAGDRS